MTKGTCGKNDDDRHPAWSGWTVVCVGDYRGVEVLSDEILRACVRHDQVLCALVPHSIALHYVTLRAVALHDVVLHDVALRDVALRHVALRDAALLDEARHDAALRDGNLHDVTLGALVVHASNRAWSQGDRTQSADPVAAVLPVWVHYVDTGCHVPRAVWIYLVRARHA